ncbi:MAG: peptide-N-glycosidase F-related protein [Ferruginibacter sp.]
MKRKISYALTVFSVLLITSITSCKKDHTETELPSITVANSNQVQDFGTIVVGQISASKSMQINGAHLTGDVTITASENYSLSLDNTTFTSILNLNAATAATGKIFYVRFSPTVLGVKPGTVKFESTDANTITVALTGTGGIQQTYSTFASEQLAFGTGLSQSASHDYTLASDVSLVNKINMYVKLRCPGGGCGAWDVYAHIQIKDPASGEWYELGRYITPYGVDNHTMARGFEIDVTDFKSLLQGTVTLRAFTEVWTTQGWLLSVDFDYLQGTPDYPYYAIAKVIQFNDNSLGGVPYGEDASAFDVNKTVTIPTNSEATSLRTVISGWGEATPNDPDGRPCAEWCFRTHHININGANTFSHVMSPLGCASNAVPAQAGNWQPNRAGWCPGMAVPVREDQMATNMAGQSFTFEYVFQPWVNDLSAGNANPHAYNAISTYVVVKSSTPIVKPTVTN